MPKSRQEMLCELVRERLVNSEFPNILMSGPPGSGKKTIVHTAIIPAMGRKNVLEINCGRCIGITHVREHIISFAHSVVAREEGQPSFKLVILYSAGLLSKEAQAALRRCIEDNASTTRFIFVVENAYDIILPLQSRCVELYCGDIGKTGLVNYYQARKLPALIPRRSVGNVIDRLILDLDKTCPASVLDAANSLHAKGVGAEELYEYLSRRDRLVEGKNEAIKNLSGFKSERMGIYVVLNLIR